MHTRHGGVNEAMRDALGDPLAARKPFDQPGRRLLLVVLVGRRERRVDAETGEEGTRHARVLGGDHVHPGEQPERAQRDVGCIADGQRNYIQ